MSKPVVDMTDWTNGTLTVIRRAASRGRSTAACWLCRCSCGNEVVHRGDQLRQGRVHTCGCGAGGKRERAVSQVELDWFEPKVRLSRAELEVEMSQLRLENERLREIARRLAGI